MLIGTSWRSDHRSFGVLSIYLIHSVLYIHVAFCLRSPWHYDLAGSGSVVKFILCFLQNHPQITFILLGAFLHSVVVSPVWSPQVDMSLNRRVLFLPRCFWRKRCFSVLCDNAISVPLQETSFVSAGSYTVLMELLSLFNLPCNTNYWQLMRMRELKWRKMTRSRWAYNSQAQNISGTNLGIV